MKCPKCGSELIYRSYHRGRYIGKKCENMHFVSKEELDKMQYQARLDKVLSKFEDTLTNEAYYEIVDEKIVFDITYIKSEFYLTVATPNNYEHHTKISLDTVESLLNDLEAQK